MKNLYFAVAMAIAIFAFVGCNADCDAETWETPNTPIETSYDIKTSHIKSELANDVVLDDHQATLVNKNNNTMVASQMYTAKHRLNVGYARFSRSVAESLRGSIVGFDNGFNLNGQNIPASVELIGCESVFFETNYTCYCHQEFAQDGAIAKLTCCEIIPIRIEIGNINGNVLYADVIFKGHTEIAYPVEFAITEDDVYGYEYDDYAVVTGNGTATLNEYETKNGVLTGKVNILEGTFVASLKAGAEIVKTSAATPSLNGNIGNINGNNVSFSYTLDGTTFTDSWTATMQSEVEFVTSDGKKIRRALKDSYTVKSVSFNRNENIWSNKAELYIANYVCDSDVQKIRIESVKGYEHDDHATIINPTEIGLNVYPTVNGVRTGEVIVVKSNYSATLTAGAMIERTSKEALRITSTTATLSGNNASFSYALGNESFNDTWKYSATASANFTLPDGSTVSVPVKATYSVKSTSFTSNNGVYSNAATLYAGNIALASDVQQIKVNAPIDALIDGYTAIAAYITTCYHSSNNNLVSDGNHLVIVFRNNTDKSKYIVRHANGTMTTSGKDFSFNNLNENAVYSMVTVNGAMVPAYLDVITSGNSAVEWGYIQIGVNYTFPVDKFRVTTDRLSNPIIEEGKVIDGVVVINGLKFK